MKQLTLFDKTTYKIKKAAKCVKQKLDSVCETINIIQLNIKDALSNFQKMLYEAWLDNTPDDCPDLPHKILKECDDRDKAILRARKTRTKKISQVIQLSNPLEYFIDVC